MRRILLFFTAAAVCLMFSGKPGFAGSQIRIVTTTSVLADLAAQIAGDEAEIYSVASPKRNLHTTAPTPKDVLKTRKADVFIYHGLHAEPWLLPLLNAAGKQEFLEAGGHAIDASSGIHPLEIPDEVTRLEGDIHPQGNPHYWLDPAKAKIVAENITDALSHLYPDRAEGFRSRNQRFQRTLDAKIADWTQRMAPFRGTAIVTYHRSWSYFAQAYGLEVVGEIEPKPGIPPTAKHLQELLDLMKRKRAALVVKEPYQEDKTPKRIAQEADAKVVEIPQFNGAKKGADDYLGLMEYNITQIEKALREVDRE